MKKHFIQMIKDMPFRKKLIGICLLVSLVPMSILGIFFYYQLRTTLTERAYTALNETLRRETDHIGGTLESYLAVMDFIAADEDMENALSRDYASNYDMYIAYRDTIDPLLETMRILYPGLNSILFYSNSGIYPHGTSLRPLSDAEDSVWYTKTLSTLEPQFTFSEDGKTLFITRQVYLSETKYTHILAASVNIRSLLGSVGNVYEDDFGFLIFDQENTLQYYYTNSPDCESFLSLPAEQLLSGDFPENYAVQACHMDAAGWTALLYRPIPEVHTGAITLIITIFFLFMGSILIVFFLGAKLTAFVIQPLTNLSDNMRNVEQGSYELTLEADRKDEVGLLIGAFNAMIKQQNHLVNEVLSAKIAYQKYELHILQAQINPHFLYNSLSLIGSRAIRCGQKDIYQIAQLLAAFYRTVLNKGRTVVTVSEEFDNVKSYISIQQIMHSNSFETVYEIDSSLYECRMPNMLLQPLAENAILHGLDNKETPGMGILTISCFEQDGDIIFKVMDNGGGMTQEQCENIIRKDSRGYGTKNVHQRVQLYYGERYGVSFNSIPGQGCCAILRIGRNIPEG